tara:strand:- start:4607 stop:4921 length:315 start_codon:yes stop_codon:yes gene_type:complete
MVEKEKTSGSEKRKSIVGTLSLRGRKFQGTVIRKIGNRVTIEFERTKLISKYERYIKTKTKMHARLPSEIDVEVGDYIQVQECRPLSKILHHVVVKKIRGRDEK